MLRAGTSLFLAVLAVAGCRAPSPHDDLDRAAKDFRLARVQRLGGALVDGTPIVWRVSRRSGLGAWAWPEGRIDVSRTLVDRLDDDELTAALAHEVGHLLDGGHLDGVPLSLLGGDLSGDLELRADRIGGALLARRGVACEAMPRMLAKLAAGRGGDAGVARRAAVASAACTAAH